MSTSASKKAKTEKKGNGNEFELVKKYLLECPHVSNEHPAIKAALDGMDKELKRRERDAKLQRKFAGEKYANTATATGASSTTAECSIGNTALSNSELSSSDVVVVETTAASNSQDDSEIMDWQDVMPNSKKDESDDDGGTGFLGKELAKIAIDSISEHQVKVQSPVAAIAVALHAALRSDLLRFACTGIPQDTAASKGGFAPPIRELPKHQFLPPKWDASASSSSTSESSQQVRLRYRKNGTGALILIVIQEEGDNIQVQLRPPSTQEPPSQPLVFALNEHVNLDSWNAALKGARSIPPALHYKGLAMLLTNFCRTFDLGSIQDNALDSTKVTDDVVYVDNTIVHTASTSGSSSRPVITKSDFVTPQPPPQIPGTAASQRRPWDDDDDDGSGVRVPSTMSQAFPPLRTNPRGDFASDLAPAGLVDPRFAPPDGRMGGSVMGPNHPLFVGNGGGVGPRLGGPPGGAFGGPGTMQPRFDPAYPNEIYNDDGTRGGGRNAGRRSGEPNPDHLRMPNSFGRGNMFS